eukprot:gene15139-20387_t
MSSANQTGDVSINTNSDCYVLKVLVLGDAATGKTSIIKRYVNNYFTSVHKTTIGVDFQLKQITVQNKNIHLQLWDIAGQERFGNMTRVYYKEALGAILVYDVSRPATYETVTAWKDEIDIKLTLPNGEPLPVVLLGNKCDLDADNIDRSRLEEFCKKKGFVRSFDTSAKDNINIDEAISCLVTAILKHEDLFTTKKAKQ